MKTVYRLAACMFLAALLASLAAPVMAQEPRVALGGNMPAVPSQGQGPADPAELETVLDGSFVRSTVGRSLG